MISQKSQIIEVTTRIKTTGFVDQELLDHLGIHAEGDFREKRSLGYATPNEPEVIDKYEDTELELIDVDCRLIKMDIHQRASNDDISIMLAALRHLQTAVRAGDSLTYLEDIIDMGMLNNERIDLICENINVESLEENYHVIAMSTAHLTESDRDAFNNAINDGDQMLLSRDSGFFLKLFDDDLFSNYRHGHSYTIKDIIRWAYQEGYRMIEFDCDAQSLPQFPVFDW